MYVYQGTYGRCVYPRHRATDCSGERTTRSRSTTGHKPARCRRHPYPVTIARGTHNTSKPAPPSNCTRRYTAPTATQCRIEPQLLSRTSVGVKRMWWWWFPASATPHSTFDSATDDPYPRIESRPRRTRGHHKRIDKIYRLQRTNVSAQAAADCRHFISRCAFERPRIEDTNPILFHHRTVDTNGERWNLSTSRRHLPRRAVSTSGNAISIDIK